MASILIASSPPSSIDYSIVDGRVREFIHRGMLIYDERTGVALAGWREALVELTVQQGLNVESAEGLHAFVKRMAADGLLTIV